MAGIRLIDHDAVLATVDARRAIDAVREGFIRYAKGEWAMPPKLYLDSPPWGDFRAMPARGEGLAIVKWVTSFPRNPAQGLPTVTGMIIVSDAENGEPLALVDGRAVTALRTGAVAPVATRALAPADAATVGVIGCGAHGTWTARCMAADGYGPGVCFDEDAEAARRLADELGWRTGTREDAAGCDVVCTVTPGFVPVVADADLKPGAHVNALGADGPGKIELMPTLLSNCRLYCDEFEQSAHGGEFTAPITTGRITRADVTELGDVLLDPESLRPAAGKISIFDSTGLAIQDLAICVELVGALREGVIDAPEIAL